MKLKDFPLLAAFCGGAFSANSAGKVTTTTPIHVPVEQAQEAEAELADQLLDESILFQLGQLADHGMTLTRYDEETDANVTLKAYAILDTYY